MKYIKNIPSLIIILVFGYIALGQIVFPGDIPMNGNICDVIPNDRLPYYQETPVSNTAVFLSECTTAIFNQSCYISEFAGITTFQIKCGYTATPFEHIAHIGHA